MERRFELMDIESSCSKLTIAIDRVTLKLPVNIDKDMRDRVIRFANDVSSKIEYPLTVRGYIEMDKKYNGLTTILYTKSRNGDRKREEIFTFNEGEGE